MMCGAFFVPVENGSDKTTVSVGTEHQEYHPEYTSPGPLTNIARCGHGNAVLPTTFLPILKSRYIMYC
jgi:Plavaka transposase